MKASFYPFAIVLALVGCTGEAPDRSDDGLVFVSGSYTYPIKQACVADIALDHDDTSNPVVTVNLVESSECSGELQEFTETHIGDQMSLRFKDQELVRDANVVSHLNNTFTVLVDSNARGKAIIDYY